MSPITFKVIVMFRFIKFAVIAVINKHKTHQLDFFLYISRNSCFFSPVFNLVSSFLYYIHFFCSIIYLDSYLMTSAGTLKKQLETCVFKQAFCFCYFKTACLFYCVYLFIFLLNFTLLSKSLGVKC